MAKTTQNNIKLGIFVTLGTVLFILGVYFIGNQQNLFRPRYRLHTFVPDANGLREGTNVRYAGMVVGSVEKVGFVNDSTLHICMVLDATIRHHIRQDAVASIGTEGLVGNVIVNITPGKGNKQPAGNGDTLSSYTKPDPNVLLEALSTASNNVALISQRLLNVSEELDSGDGMIPRLLHDPDVATDWAQSMQNLRRVTENMAQLSGHLRSSMEAAANGEGTLGYLLHDQTLPKKLEHFADRLDSLVIVQAQPVIEDLQKSGRDIAASSEALKTAMGTLQGGPGLASTILTDSSAANDLRAILENLNEGTDRFNQNMEALKHNFLFRKYFKKLDKEKQRAKGFPEG